MHVSVSVSVLVSVSVSVSYSTSLSASDCFCLLFLIDSVSISSLIYNIFPIDAYMSLGVYLVLSLTMSISGL